MYKICSLNFGFLNCDAVKSISRDMNFHSIGYILVKNSLDSFKYSERFPIKLN